MLDSLASDAQLSSIFSLSTKTLTDLLDQWGYPLVSLFVAIESSGIPFPGETMLVTASVYAGTGHLSILGVIVAAAIGAIMGDNAGYLAGRTGGRSLALRFGHRIWLRPHHLNQAERFFDRHGDKTVFFGRHVAILRAWAAFLAGVNRMPWPKFLLYNAAGGIVWVTMYGLLGYTLGHNLPLLRRILQYLGIGGFVIAAIVIAVALVMLRRRMSARGAATDQSRRSRP